MENYDIDSLIKTFERHSKEWDIQHEKNQIHFKDAPWVKDDFSMARALMEICKEIKALKDKGE